ncbi:MAG: zinc ribbon domain-containing protein [Chloroflexota bacterium]|nr:zinc ribbon domain-containing protein [Chloroflexota bacterium]
MPLYEYYCTYCGQRFDKLVSMSTPTSEVVCPSCERKQAQRLVSQVSSLGADCGTLGGGGG